MPQDLTVREMKTSMLMIISTLLLIFGARALILDPVGLVYAPASIGKRQVVH